jgi:hypothetical protein
MSGWKIFMMNSVIWFLYFVGDVLYGVEKSEHELYYKRTGNPRFSKVFKIEKAPKKRASKLLKKEESSQSEERIQPSLGRSFKNISFKNLMKYDTKSEKSRNKPKKKEPKIEFHREYNLRSRK